MSDPDPTALVLGWRSEWAADLKEIQKATSALKVAYEATAENVRAATAEHQGVVKLLLKPFHTQNGTRYESAESLIEALLGDLRSKVEQARSCQARAKADLEAACTKADNLKAALRQIDRAIPNETEEAS